MNRIVVLAGLVLALIGVGAFARPSSAQDPEVRLNHIQVLGTHNSYHLAPHAPLIDLIEQFDPDAALSFEYSHRPLAEQFGVLGVRQVELDVFADPGPVPLFAAPIGEAAILGPDAVPVEGLLAPGEKVLHIQDIDYRSTCLTLVACLQEIEDWSAANPNHLPILVLIEAKDGPLVLPPELPGIGPVPPAAEPVPIGGPELDAIDATIRSVFAPRHLITPDDVRGSHATLEEAVLAGGWPTLDEARGRVLFALDNEDAKRDAYIVGHVSLQGRVMFTSSEPGTPEAAFVKRNDPVAGLAEIQDLVAKGYLVRTRADADTVEARLGATARRDAALASGAQFVSTDYPELDAALGTGYAVDIPGDDVGRCNPVSAPAACDAALFENPAPSAPTATPATPGPPSTGSGLAPQGAPSQVLPVAIVVVVAGLTLGGWVALRRSRGA